MPSTAESAEPTPGPELVGRQAELTTLRDLADLAVEHGARMVLVSGEAGIGKTTLIGEFLGRLTASGWGGHVGACIEYADRPLPFGPIVSILRSVLLGDLEEIDELVGHHRRDLAGLLPELAEADAVGPSLEGDVDRLFDAIAATLTAASTRRPIAVLVEDIHWADPATRDLLSTLVHVLGPARVLILVTERTGATERDHPVRTWIAEHRRLSTVHTIELVGLSRDELATQATRLLDDTPDTGLLDELVERTGGNPYFSHELLVARRDGGRELPVSLAEFLSSRLARLGDDERELLRALAIAGGAADHRMLRAMLPDLDVGRIQRSLFDASILELDGDELSFGHALLREAILGDVLPFEAEELHRRAAEAIAADPRRGHSLRDLAGLALHWDRADDPDRSLGAAIDAADAAAAVAAYEAAADLSLQALAAWPAAADPTSCADITRDQLLLQAAEWLASCYRGEEAVAIIEAALAGWAHELPPGTRALLSACMAPIHWHLGNPPETARLLAEAEQLVGDEVSPEAAQVHHRISKQALADGQIHPALESAERAIAIAEQHGPEVVLVEALTTKALAVGVTGDLDSGVALVREARDLARSGELVSQVANSYRTEMLITLFQAGRTDACLDASRHGLRYAEEHCGPRWRAEFRLDLCLGYVEGGRLLEAEPLFGLLLTSELDDLRRLTVLQTAGLHALATGSYELAEAFLDDATEIAERYHSAQETGFHARLQAELARRQGRLDDAVRLIDGALELQLAGDNLTYTRESIVEKLRIVRACTAAGHPDAERLVAEAAALVEAFDGTGLANRAMRALMNLELGAATGRTGPAVADEAISLLDESGYLHESAQARLLQIDHLVASDPTQRSTLQAQVADLHQLASTHGMAGITDQLAAVAERAGIALAPGEERPTPVGRAELPHHLTAREVEVMSLLAEGLTNKEIAERLYVSPRTVGTHVSNLLAKVGVTTRGAAAAVYHRLGLAEVIDLRDTADTSATASTN